MTDTESIDLLRAELHNVRGERDLAVSQVADLSCTLDEIEATLLIVPIDSYRSAIRMALDSIDGFRSGKRALQEQAELLTGERCPQCGHPK